MRFRTAAMILLGALALGMSLVPVPAPASDNDGFRSPTGNIGCGYYDDILRCDVVDGVVPLPPMPKTCEYDWGQGFWLHKHGMARIVCASDTARGATKILAYGSTWSRGSFTCKSSVNGFRCTNLDGHGFTIAKGEAHRF